MLYISYKSPNLVIFHDFLCSLKSPDLLNLVISIFHDFLNPIIPIEEVHIPARGTNNLLLQYTIACIELQAIACYASFSPKCMLRATVACIACYAC